MMAKVLDCGLKISEFELQLYYYVHFWTNVLEEGMNLFILNQLYVEFSSTRMTLALNNP